MLWRNLVATLTDKARFPQKLIMLLDFAPFHQSFSLNPLLIHLFIYIYDVQKALPGF
jgi:hypothetical protein